MRCGAPLNLALAPGIISSEKPMEARKYVWEGAIPLQIHLHDSEVTSLPPPLPTLILAPRIGYLPLLAPLIKPHFTSSLPPGLDTIWFDYKGLPLKWYIPTGVLFDLLCAELERPWNLTVHFRGYPTDVLTPCDGDDSVKWSFINSLKEAAYIITGNSKNIMNMSHTDQVDLWHSVMDADLDAYARISSKLKLGAVEDDYTSSCITKSQQSTSATESGQVKTGRIPVRLYVRNETEDFDDFEDLHPVDSWDKISYINQPVEIGREGKYFTLLDALKMLLPDYFWQRAPSVERSPERVEADGQVEVEETTYEHVNVAPEIKLVRIQGIEPKLDIPFSWVVNKLMNPEHFLHICVCIKLQGRNAT